MWVVVGRIVRVPRGSPGPEGGRPARMRIAQLRGWPRGSEGDRPDQMISVAVKRIPKKTMEGSSAMSVPRMVLEVFMDR